ncbi:hypothetical protein EON79_06210 [bacterium]|nr:MAG: hypothetical protein EON79_06210 [bacterium]
MTTLPTKARLALRDAQEAREAGIARKAGPTVQERREDLTRFYERYETLVETVCDAAQYGPDTKLERRYTEEKRAYQADYDSVAPYVAAFLRPAPEDADQHPFESFSAHETLADFVASDDGTVISRITRTREALTLYGEHLRQLQAKHG